VNLLARDTGNNCVVALRSVGDLNEFLDVFSEDDLLVGEPELFSQVDFSGLSLNAVVVDVLELVDD
jgi:hypothetical protein